MTASMTCQDSAYPAHSPNTLVPEMLPYLQQHPALPHHLYFLQNDSISQLPPYHDQSTFQHDQHVNPPESQYHRQDFHDHQLQHFHKNSKNAVLFQVQCSPTFSTSQSHSPNNVMNDVQLVKMPVDSSPLNVAFQENNFSSPLVQLQTFHLPQFPQKMLSHPPPVPFSMPYPSTQQNLHGRSCSPPPSYENTSIPPASSFLSPSSNFHYPTPPSVAPHQNRTSFQQLRSSQPSNSHNSSAASPQFSHNINPHCHHHQHHHSASQPQRQIQQSSSITCLSFSRRVVKPSQLDLARQITP